MTASCVYYTHEVCRQPMRWSGRFVDPADMCPWLSLYCATCKAWGRLNEEDSVDGVARARIVTLRLRDSDSAVIVSLDPLVSSEPPPPGAPQRMTDAEIEAHLAVDVAKIHPEDLWRWRRQLFESSEPELFWRFHEWWQSEPEWNALPTDWYAAIPPRMFLRRSVPVEVYHRAKLAVDAWLKINAAGAHPPTPQEAAAK